MNKIFLLIVFALREGAGKARGEYDEVKMLSNCLHLIKENET